MREISAGWRNRLAGCRVFLFLRRRGDDDGDDEGHEGRGPGKAGFSVVQKRTSVGAGPAARSCPSNLCSRPGMQPLRSSLTQPLRKLAAQLPTAAHRRLPKTTKDGRVRIPWAQSPKFPLDTGGDHERILTLSACVPACLLLALEPCGRAQLWGMSYQILSSQTAWSVSVESASQSPRAGQLLSWRGQNPSVCLDCYFDKNRESSNVVALGRNGRRGRLDEGLDACAMTMNQPILII